MIPLLSNTNIAYTLYFITYKILKLIYFIDAKSVLSEATCYSNRYRYCIILIRIKYSNKKCYRFWMKYNIINIIIK